MKLSLTEYIIGIAGWAIIFFILYKKSSSFKETDYYKCTGRPWISTFFLGKGSVGEYLIYKYLKPIKGYKRFLFNCYIPKDNDETTEIDVIMIHETGIHVFESKNYSGWIFGNESSFKWTQVLPTGRGKSEKSRFLNPIIQNKGHIKWLDNYLNNQEIPFYSYIVFSERCTLKDITLSSNDQKVINRNMVGRSVNKNIESNDKVLYKERIDEIYNVLYPLTQADAEEKLKHIQKIKTNKLQRVSGSAFENKIIKSASDTIPKCPHCGGELVLRVARKGKNAGKKFYGCSNYPKCSFTRNIE